MQIAMSKTRERFPLSTKKVLKKTVAGTLGSIIALLFMYFIIMLPVLLAPSESGPSSGFIGVFTLVIFGLSALILVVTYLYQQWYYATYFYDLTSDYIIIKKGPITPKEITIPYERVQDVYVDQDLLDRIFGIYDVHLSSATFSSGMAAHIDGVEKADADGLREVLLKAVSERISRNRVSANPTPAPAQYMPPVPPIPPRAQ
jgi:putative membrane protein